MSTEKDGKVKLPVVSYSKITSFKACPKKYKLCYIDKLERAQSPYADFGNFCHEILEKFHGAYMRFNGVPKPNDMKNTMIEIFNSKVKEYKNKLTKEQIDEGYDIMKLYLKQVIDQARDNVYPNIVALERKIWEPVNDKFNFYGFIDRLQKDSDGILHVMDYKTTKNKRYLKDRTQLMLYGYFVYVKDPTITKVRTSYILLRHKMGLMTEEHTIDDLKTVKEEFANDWDKVQEEKLFRANPRFDTCTICDFADKCQEGRELLQRRKSFVGREAGW